MSPPERMLWRHLKLRPYRLKFRSQHPLGRLSLDFYCAERRLAVEIDGEGHGRGDRPARDERRDAWLRAQGIAVLRVTASEVLRDAAETADAIARYAAALPLAFSAPQRKRRDPPQLAGEVAARSADGGAVAQTAASPPLHHSSDGPPPQRVGEDEEESAKEA